MDTNSPVRLFLLEHLRRMLLASLGLALFAVGTYLQLKAAIGYAPWQALHEGLAQHLSMSYGNASILVSIAVVVADLLLREPIGIGTILDSLLVGWITDLCLWLDPISDQEGWVVPVLLLVAGLFVMAYGQYVYMTAALSCGPRDALAVALCRRFPRFSMGGITAVMLAAVLLAGWLLGGPIGFGTLIHLVVTGPIIDLVFRLVRFDPRSVEHEGLAQTIRGFTQARLAHSLD